MIFTIKKKTRKKKMSIFKEFSLNSQQISWAIGLILSDAWFKGKWLYLRQSVKNTALLEQTETVFGPLCTNRVPHYNKEGKINAYEIRVGPHEDFNTLSTMFYPFGLYRNHGQTYYPRGGKIIPQLGWLNQFMNYEVLAVWIMGDGSVKSKDNKSIEIHTNGFPLESASRGAISIYETTGITCKVSVEKARNMPVVYVCGENIEILRDKVRPLMHKDLQYKIPTPRVREFNPTGPSVCSQWYEGVKDASWRDNTQACIIEIEQRLKLKKPSKLKKQK